MHQPRIQKQNWRGLYNLSLTPTPRSSPSVWTGTGFKFAELPEALSESQPRSRFPDGRKQLGRRKEHRLGFTHPWVPSPAPSLCNCVMLGWSWSRGSVFLTLVLKHKSKHVTSMLNELQPSCHSLQESDLCQYRCCPPYLLPLAFLSKTGESLSMPCFPHACLLSYTVHFCPPEQTSHLVGWENSFIRPKLPSSLLHWPSLRFPYLQINSTTRIVYLLTPVLGTRSESREAGMEWVEHVVLEQTVNCPTPRMQRWRGQNWMLENRGGAGHRVVSKELPESSWCSAGVLKAHRI